MRSSFSAQPAIRALLALLACTGCAAAAHADPANVDTLTASQAAQRICAGTLTSEQVVSAYLQKAKSRPELNAFVLLDEVGALRAAREFDRHHQQRGRCEPLGGVPVLIKANIQVQGMPNTDGTPALQNFIAHEDAPVVGRLRAAGAIIMGITTMHETAFGVTGYNSIYRYQGEIGVRNAYDSTRVAGGSSAGNGAALGARMAPAALGSDTGGSVRIPCSFNGCAALRPTVGRYPGEGVAPLSHTRDTVGPMAQSVADLALLDQVLAGGGTAGSGSAIRPADLKKIRLGIVADFMAHQDDDTLAATKTALDKLREAGVTLVEVSMPQLAQLNSESEFPIVMYEARDDLQAYLKKYGTGVDLEHLVARMAGQDEASLFKEQVLPRKTSKADGGRDLTPIYEQVMHVSRPAMQRLYQDTFDQYHLDALVFPTIPRVAPTVKSLPSDTGLFRSVIQNTGPGSIVGIPGLTLPSGLGRDSRVPIGLEIDGPAGSDRRLLSIGLSLEKVLGRLSPPN